MIHWVRRICRRVWRGRRPLVGTDIAPIMKGSLFARMVYVNHVVGVGASYEGVPRGLARRIKRRLKQ